MFSREANEAFAEGWICDGVIRAIYRAPIGLNEQDKVALDQGIAYWESIHPVTNEIDLSGYEQARVSYRRSRDLQAVLTQLADKLEIEIPVLNQMVVQKAQSYREVLTRLKEASLLDEDREALVEQRKVVSALGWKLYHRQVNAGQSLGYSFAA